MTRYFITTLLLLLLWNPCCRAQREPAAGRRSAFSTAMQQILIDKITVPKNAVPQLLERLAYNLALLARQPGLLESQRFERTDELGRLVIVTVAIWRDSAALARAKAAVQDDYRRQQINLPELLQRWGVTMERSIYHRATN